ncbi:MAG: cellulase family glycosylhydrolase [Eubacteriales bacterium]|nr:cellulase family glycosylhydrolase [Eubacteriales bacterium]
MNSSSLKKITACLIGTLLSSLLIINAFAAAGSSTASSSTSASAAGSATGSATAAGAPTYTNGAAAGYSYNSGPNDAGALHLEGTRLTSESGYPVQLKGVSTHGLAWFPDYVNQDCFSFLRNNWNVNVIRLSMYTAEYGGYCAGGDQARLKTLIRNGVRYATAANMYAIIDWHILSDGNPGTYADQAAAFFSEMSAEFANNINVIYEICNEPNGGTSWAEIKRYAERIIPLIKANDPDAVIIVGTPTWSQEVDKAAADPISGYSNIMYSMHFYAATHKDDLRHRMANAVEAGLPIFVTEYGTCDASGGGSVDTESAGKWVSLMDSYGISYVNWSLCNKAETASILAPSCSSHSGFSYNDLSDSGKWLMQMLTKGSTYGLSSAALGVTNGSGTAIINSGSGSAASGSAAGAAAGPGSASSSFDYAYSTVSGNNGSFSYELTKVNSWESGGQSYVQYSASVKNNSGSRVSSWTISIPFDRSIHLSDSWNGSYRVNGNTLTISNLSYNGNLASGGSATDVGFIVYADAFPAAN